MTESKRILVVEDEFIVAAMLCDTLEDEGMVPLGPIGRVDEGLAFIASEKFDAAVLDWNLSGESGEALAHALADKGIPFVIATGYGAVEAPFDDRPILGKPYVARTLIEKLTTLLS